MNLSLPEKSAGKVRRREHQAPRKREGSWETASEGGKVHRGRDPEEHRLGEGNPMREEEEDTTPGDPLSVGPQAAGARNC